MLTASSCQRERSAVDRDRAMAVAATWLEPEAQKAKKKHTTLLQLEVSFRVEMPQEACVFLF